jgi:hypothetical protein
MTDIAELIRIAKYEARGKKAKALVSRTPDNVLLLKRLEYGPEGFRCVCGSSNFVRTHPWPAFRKGREITGARWEHRCVNCGVKYIFVPRLIGEPK